MTEESTCNDENPRYFGTWLWFLDYRIDFIKVDIPTSCRVMFQELTLITLLGFLAVMVDWIYDDFIRGAQSIGEPSLWQVTAPLAFLVTITLAKYFDSKIFPHFCSLTKLQSDHVKTSAAERIARTLIILVALLAINVSPDLIGRYSESINYVASFLPFYEKIKSPPALISFLELWNRLSTKLLTTSVLITFCRFYIDLAILSYNFCFGKLSKAKEFDESKKSDMMKKKKEPFDENENDLEDEAIAGRLNNPIKRNQPSFHH